MLRLFLSLVLVTAISGCIVPRGAVTKSEVLRGSNSQDASFDVVDLNSTSLAMVEKWPRTGGGLKHGWIGGSRGASDYIIRSGDILSLSIWDSQEDSLLTGTGQKEARVQNIRVSSGGSVYLPYIGNVQVAGKTIESARNTIARQMESIAPSVQVLVSAQPGQNNIARAVDGVSRPGAYPLTDRSYSVLNLIADAGGVADSIQNPVVRLMRGGGTYEIFASELTENSALDTALRGGDKVLVTDLPQNVTVMGATGREMQVPLKYPPVTALQAVTNAGGLTDTRANPKGLLVLRQYEHNAVRLDTHGPDKDLVIFALDMTNADGLFAAQKFEVFPGDIVYASESPLVLINNFLDVFRASGATFVQAQNLAN